MWYDHSAETLISTIVSMIVTIAQFASNLSVASVIVVTDVIVVLKTLLVSSSSLSLVSFISLMLLNFENKYIIFAFTTL